MSWLLTLVTLAASAADESGSGSGSADSENSLLVHAIEVAFYTNVQVSVMVAIGAYGIFAGFIDGGTLKNMARLVLSVLFPALTFSFFTAFSAEQVGKWSPILLASLLHIYGGGLLAWLGARLAMLPSPYDQLCIISIAFGNVAALPFVMIGPIVENWRGAVQYEGGIITTQDAKLYGGGMVALYASMWILNFFSIGKWYISTIPELGETASSQREARDQAAASAPAAPGWKRSAKFALDLLLEPTVLGTCFALFCGCVPPLKHTFCGHEADCSDGALRFVASASKELGNTGVTLSTIVLGAALMLSHKAQRAKVAAAKAAESVAAAGGENALELSVAPANNATLSTAVATTDGGDAHDVAMLRRAGGGAPSPWMALDAKQRCYVVIILTKLALLPAVFFPLTYLAVQAGALPSDNRLLQIVIYMQAAVPSSQTAVSFLAASGKPKLSQELSGLYVPQYLVSTLSIALAIVVAINLIGED